MRHRDERGFSSICSTLFASAKSHPSSSFKLQEIQATFCTWSFVLSHLAKLFRLVLWLGDLLFEVFLHSFIVTCFMIFNLNHKPLRLSGAHHCHAWSCNERMLGSTVDGCSSIVPGHEA